MTNKRLNGLDDVCPAVWMCKTWWTSFAATHISRMHLYDLGASKDNLTEDVGFFAALLLC